MSDLIWHNGAFRPDEPVFFANDRLRIGEGVFNTILCLDGTLIHGHLHMKKLLRNSKIFTGEWEHPSSNDLESIARSLLAKNGFTKGRYAINTIITLGAGKGGIQTPDRPDIQIIMRAFPAPEIPSQIHAIIAQTTRRNEHSPLSQIKGPFYGDNILALREAAEKGANEAIMLNTSEKIACATTSNIVAILNGKLTTPPLNDGCQDGITRSLLMQKFEVIEQSMTPDDLYSSDGIYLLNSLRGAVPVLTLDGKTLSKPSITIDKDFHLE